MPDFRLMALKPFALTHRRFHGRFATILADPPWRFSNRTGKVSPEHRRLSRYRTLSLDEICGLPVGSIAADTAHLYLWVPNALLPDGLTAMRAWGFEYKSMLVWHKVRADGGSDGRGMGFYFRNVTECLLFGTRGRGARTRAAGRRQTNLIAARKREHSRKPDEQYPIIDSCSPGPRIELFARHKRVGWTSWGNEVGEPIVWLEAPVVFTGPWPALSHPVAPAERRAPRTTRSSV